MILAVPPGDVFGETISFLQETAQPPEQIQFIGLKHCLKVLWESTQTQIQDVSSFASLQSSLLLLSNQSSEQVLEREMVFLLSWGLQVQKQEEKEVGFL